MRSPLSYTVENYRALPETGPSYQLVEGDLMMTPAPNTKHQRILRNVGFFLNHHVRNTGQGEVFYVPFDVILSETDVVQPDILFIRQEHRSRITSQGLEGPPDFVIEILSASTEMLDRGLKRKLYARKGVEELWIVDPKQETLEVYRLQKEPEKPVAFYGKDASVESLVLPGFLLNLQEVFPEKSGQNLGEE